MRDCFFFFGSSKPQVKSENDRRKPLVISHDYDTAAAGDELHYPTAAMALILQSWLHGHKLRYLFLVLCSPLLIPLLCATFPFLCAAEIFVRLCGRRRFKSTPPRNPLPPPVRRPVNDVKGGNQVKSDFSLLDRYLDDQLELAIEILHECGGDLSYGFDYIDDFDSNRSSSLC